MTMSQRMVFIAGMLCGCEQDLGLVPQKTEIERVDTDGGEGASDVDVDSDAPAAEPDEVVPQPELVVSPRFLDFGEHPVASYAELEVELANVGEANLRITNMQLFGSPAFTVYDMSARMLTPGEVSTVTVGFSATSSAEVGGLTFRSNDPWLPEVTVALEGAGVDDGSLVAPGLDFGPVRVNTTAVQDWPLHNQSATDVLVTGVLVSDSHFVVELPNPVNVPAGGTEVVPVRFRPSAPVAYSATLTVLSTAANTPPPVDAVGQGADKPVALCSVNPPVVTAIHDAFTWVGSTSYDPAGRAITSAQWTLLSKPPGSALSMPGGSSLDRGPVTPDSVGLYTAQLIVTNDLGEQSDPCTTTLQAEANADLWVEMFWQHAEDIDLHLVRAQGLYNTSSDCYYGNCVGSGLPWGGPGTADDPFLDLDDRFQTGPENINIASPPANTFRVVVHDHPFRAYQPANRVTVKVYVFGVEQLSTSFTMSGENTWREVALVDWTVWPPTVTPL